MGHCHAASGSVAYLGMSALANHLGHPQSPATVLAGTAVCAGAALLPDLDMSGKVTSCQGGAAIARTFGVASLFVAEVVEKVSLGVYNATKTRRDPARDNGHRTLTHTLAFNVALGAAVYALCVSAGAWAVLPVLFLMLAASLRGMAGRWAARVGWLVTTGVAALLAVAMWLALPGEDGYRMLGLAVGLGGLAHLAGDMLTSHGCPLLWPLRIGGRRWRRIGTPRALAVTVNGKVEHYVVTPLLLVAGVAVGAYMLAGG